MVDGAHASTNWQCSRGTKDWTILLIFYGVENKGCIAKDKKKSEKLLDELAELL